MRKVLLTMVFTIFNCFLFSQGLEPNEEEALFQFNVVDGSQSPLSTNFKIKSVKTGSIYNVESNREGLAELLVPKNDSYQIILDIDPNFDEIEIPNMSYYIFQYELILDYQSSTKDIATLKYNLKNSDGEALSEDIVLTSQKDGVKYKFSTDENGLAEIKVPNNTTYIVDYTSAPDFDRVTIPNIDYCEYNFSALYEGSFPNAIYPSYSKSLLSLKYVDLDSIPVEGERFEVVSNKSGKHYTGVTDKNGDAKLLVPLGESYDVSAKYYENFVTIRVESEPSKQEYDVILSYISSLEHERREEEARKMAELRELEWKKREAEYFEYMKSVESSVTFNYGPVKDTVCSAVLNRNKHWKNKLIIMDVTGSMRPYTDQVKTWYKLNYAQNDPIQFTLFNDGDNKPDYQKRIGRIGGIHYCFGCNIKEFEFKLNYARNKGGGGDMPENDLEATIAALNTCRDYTEVILVVDNYSSVRDMSLIKQVNKPVKIILCGSYDGWVHIDYLNIAYATGGSIHTIEQDILDIGNTLDGQKVRIGNNFYVLSRGKFLHYKDERK